jgi:AcrR family transcriptional regulator
MDKRIVKTKTAIFNAIFELSTEKNLDKISVIELCKKAGINKSTFYLHYSSMEDCIKKCFASVTESVIRQGEEIMYEDISYHPEGTIAKILDTVEKYMGFLSTFKRSMVFDSSIRTLKEKFVHTICDTNHFNVEDNFHEVAKITFIVGGCVDACIQLLPHYNREELSKIMVNVIKRKEPALN